VNFSWTNPKLSYLIWRNTVSCIVMCRCRMRHGRQWWGSRREYETWCRGLRIIRQKSGTRWSSDQVVRWRRVRSTSYTWRRREALVSWFSLKTGGYGLSVVWPQNNYDSFLVWASKSRLTVWWFGPQNHRDGFLVWTPTPSGRRFVSLCVKTDERMKTVWGHTSISGCLLHREASRVRVS
jgi:hypothetical protein